MSPSCYKRSKFRISFAENQDRFMSAFSIFFITLIVSFLGTLPFGPINLSVVDITLRNSIKAGFWFSVAAALVEMGQAIVALYGSSWLNDMMVHSPWVKILGVFIFIILGLAFYFKKSQHTEIQTIKTTARDTISYFTKGMAIAFLNPQAIPFWIFVLAFLHSTEFMSISAASPLSSIVSFLLGAAFGKLGALMLFGIMSQTVLHRATNLRANLNRIIGVILIFIGMVQGIIALTT